MFQRILVGLDGSNHGLNAARAAIALAVRFESELHLLTVTRPYKVNPELRRYLEAENLLGEPKYVLDEMTDRIVSEARELALAAGVARVTAAVREGKPARALIDYASTHRIGLLVVGSRGVGEVEAALLGSVSQKAALLAKCTVMVARGPAEGV